MPGPLSVLSRRSSILSALILLAVAASGAAAAQGETEDFACAYALPSWDTANFFVNEGIQVNFGPDDLPPGYTVNFFNTSQARAFISIGLPSGEEVQYRAFYYQNYTFADGNSSATPVGEPQFAGRFVPTTWGLYTISGFVCYYGTAHNGSLPACLHLPNCLIFVQPARDERGYVRVATNNQTFAFDNGTDAFLVGENVAWTGSGDIPLFPQYFANLSAVGANYARVWLTDDWTGTQVETQLGEYSLLNAWHIDTLLFAAQRFDIRLMLAIESFNLFSTVPSMPGFWSKCVYNIANGGFLSQPQEFFTDPRAIAYFKQRLQYLLARYSWSPHVLQWELFNEVDLTDNFNATQHRGWAADMCEYIRAMDNYTHLITTSFSHNDPQPYAEVFSLPCLSHTTTHTYPGNLTTDMAENTAAFGNNRSALFRKPTYVSETGIKPGSHSLEADPTGLSLQHMLWGGVTSTAAGTGMTWWWDLWVRPADLYSKFVGVAAVAKSIPWGSMHWKPAAFLSASVAADPSWHVTAVAGAPLVPGGAGNSSTPPVCFIAYVFHQDCQWYANATNHGCLASRLGPATAAFSVPLAHIEGEFHARWLEPTTASEYEATLLSCAGGSDGTSVCKAQLSRPVPQAAVLLSC